MHSQPAATPVDRREKRKLHVVAAELLRADCPWLTDADLNVIMGRATKSKRALPVDDSVHVAEDWAHKDDPGNDVDHPDRPDVGDVSAALDEHPDVVHKLIDIRDALLPEADPVDHLWVRITSAGAAERASGIATTLAGKFVRTNIATEWCHYFNFQQTATFNFTVYDRPGAVILATEMIRKANSYFRLYVLADGDPSFVYDGHDHAAYDEGESFT